MEQKKRASALQWHPAFYAGLQIELEEEAENLIFESEHNLGTKPKDHQKGKRKTNTEKYWQNISQT